MFISYSNTRENYGDAAIGYVCLKRTTTGAATVCVIKGKICPEHKMRKKKYSVLMIVNEKTEKIQDVTCEDCPAALGKIQIK